MELSVIPKKWLQIGTYVGMGQNLLYHTKAKNNHQLISYSRLPRVRFRSHSTSEIEVTAALEAWRLGLPWCTDLEIAIKDGGRWGFPQMLQLLSPLVQETCMSIV